MTIKTLHKISSELAISSGDSIRPSKDAKDKLPVTVLEAWNSLPDEVRKALVSSEMTKNGSNATRSSTTLSSNSIYSSKNSSDESSVDDTSETLCDDDQESGISVVLKPLERAPKNVFAFEKTHVEEKVEVMKTSTSTVTTITKTVSTGRGWRNVFSLPISYDVNMVPHGTLLDPANPQLLHATGPASEDYLRRFAVIDNEVEKLYGSKIRDYFIAKGIQLTTCIINGGEADKRPDAVDKILDDLCEYKLRRREPFLAIGGGCVLDIAGMAACLYRRGVPFVRVPTTLLSIVDASVGVKNGVDYCCAVTNDTYKNRIGSFYAPSSCLLDNAFIATQDARNISNGFGEILKLALVRSEDLFNLLESHGTTLIETRFAASPSVPEGVSDRIIDLSIQIMLEELGPNLWEQKLDRCVDYGHTFSKLLEMVPGADIMHGEAVNVDGFFCVLLSYLRGFIDMETVNRIFNCMKSLSLPTNSKDLDLQLAWQSCKDAVEHRHGEQRIPLITGIGESICVSDITPEEIERALEMMKTFDH
jgi:3-dehydroquinate synthase